MNNKVKELMLEAGYVAPELAVRAQQLVELVVQECCEVAHCNFFVDGLTLGNILKEYFGVENDK